MKGIIRLSAGIVLAISIIGLTACGKMYYAADTDISDTKNTEEILPVAGYPSDSEQNSDEVLKTMELTLEDGEVLTLSVLGKKSDVDLYGVSEIRVYKNGNLIQSILMQEAIDADGVYGIDEGYTACFTAEESAGLKDVNFDGYMDLEVCGWIPNNSLPYYYWCWNNDTQQFEYFFCLQLTDIDEERQLLIAWYKVENGLYYTDYYRVNDKNELELVDREIEDVRPK